MIHDNPGKKRERPDGRTVIRYALCQLPGTALAGVALLLLQKWGGLPSWLAWTLFALWIFKDAALFPFVWRAYVSDHPPSPMVGRIGEARDLLDPGGYVRVGEEFWRAELAPGEEPVAPGAPVRIRDQKGLTLIVERAGPPPGGK